MNSGLNRTGASACFSNRAGSSMRHPIWTDLQRRSRRYSGCRAASQRAGLPKTDEPMAPMPEVQAGPVSGKWRSRRFHAACGTTRCGTAADGFWSRNTLFCCRTRCAACRADQNLDLRISGSSAWKMDVMRIEVTIVDPGFRKVVGTLRRTTLLELECNFRRPNQLAYTSGQPAPSKGH